MSPAPGCAHFGNRIWLSGYSPFCDCPHVAGSGDWKNALSKAALSFEFFCYQLLSHLWALRALTLFTLLGSQSPHTVVPDKFFGKGQKGRQSV